MTTQADRSLAITFVRDSIQEHGMPSTPEEWVNLLEEGLALGTASKMPLIDVARRARFIYDQWILGNVSRQNGMDALRKALEDAGY